MMVCAPNTAPERAATMRSVVAWTASCKPKNNSFVQMDAEFYCYCSWAVVLRSVFHYCLNRGLLLLEPHPVGQETKRRLLTPSQF